MKRILSLAFVLLLSLPLLAQEQEKPKTPEQKEREFYESIDKQVERLAESLNLEDWQIFYVDSILTHNALRMKAEAAELEKNKVSSAEPYVYVHDRWMEENDKALQKVFTPAQWDKYLKSGAGRARKARQKREEKRNKKN